MLVLDVVTWDAKDAREVFKRFGTWPGPPEGYKIVGFWSDVTGGKSWVLHELTDVKDMLRAAFDWGDLVTIEHHVVVTPEEGVPVAQEKGWL